MNRILLLHDAVGEQAPPDEQDTLVQVSQIEQALTYSGYLVDCISFTGDLLALEDRLNSGMYDVVFNLVETFHGSRFLHTIPLLCEEKGVRYTGGNATSLFLTGDKLLAKRIMHLADIPTPSWVEPNNLRDVDSFIGRPLICKPRNQEASVGIDDDSVFSCETERELRKHVTDAEKHGMILEHYIEGDECNLSVTTEHGQLRIFPIAQMHFVDYPEGKPRIIGYEAKWIEDSFAYKHTVRSFTYEQEHPEVAAQLRTFVTSLWSLFDCRGYGRVDFRIDKYGNPFVLELNMNPCIARDSGYAAACTEAGLSYDETVSRIVQEALYG